MTHPAPAVIRLRPEDAERYVALRREMLTDSPASFLSAPEDDSGSDVGIVRGRLGSADNAIFAVDEASLAGRGEGPREPGGAASPLLAVAGVYNERPKNPKVRHRAAIWGVYTTPRARGRGLSKVVMRAAIAHAAGWPGVEVVLLSVSERASEAAALYRSLGFECWGVEPDAVRLGRESYAEHHMRLVLADVR